MMIELIPSQPQEGGEPVFDSPWQARSFAMAVKLHEAGLFTWKEWADRFARVIADQERVAPIETSNDYYTLWLKTLEQLVAERAG
jgi:nitrile hydratase accessory protein